MANHLKMALVHSILTLSTQGWSQRRIARELGVDRETVSRHVRLARAKPANAPIGSAAQSTASNPANAPLGLAGRKSDCEPWRELILAKQDQGLSTKRIHQDLVQEQQAEVSYDSIRRYLRRLGRTRPLPFRRMECEPGDEAQVDFGTGAPVVGPDGKQRRPHVFRIVLSHSRKAYSEASYHQKTEDFVRCLENAFAHFGGVPRKLVIDNLRAAVKQADWFDPELVPKLGAFCEHYGVVILPTRPYTPRHKGKVERGIAYVKNNALKGRTFQSLEEENQFLLRWEETVADTRIHGTTHRQVGTVFQEIEQATLAPLPQERFPFFHEAQRIVNRDGHVEVAKAYYSAPPEYLGRTVWARWDARLVRIFDQRMKPIAVHVRRQPGRFSTHGEHLAPEKISSVERGATWLLQKVSLIGPSSTSWAQAVLEHRGVEGVRVLQGLWTLSHRHESAALEEVCRTALSYGEFRLRTLRELLKRRGPDQKQFEFLKEHPIIRPLADYGRLVSTVVPNPSFPEESCHE